MREILDMPDSREPSGLPNGNGYSGTGSEERSLMELEQLSAQLSTFAERLRRSGVVALSSPAEGSDRFRLAKDLLENRKTIDVIFDLPGLSVSPGWDILLDLFMAQQCAQRLSVTDVCFGAVAPATTVLRWVKVLENWGLIDRERDSGDKRRSFLQLSKSGSEKVNAVLLEFAK